MNTTRAGLPPALLLLPASLFLVVAIPYQLVIGCGMKAPREAAPFSCGQQPLGGWIWRWQNTPSDAIEAAKVVRITYSEKRMAHWKAIGGPRGDQGLPE